MPRHLAEYLGKNGQQELQERRSLFGCKSVSQWVAICSGRSVE